MAWFKEWFDTPFYEKLYAHRDEEEAKRLAQLIAEVFKPINYPTALDMACGRGRHSYNLARLGYKVTGLDLSKNAIAKAKENIPQDVINQPSFGIHDMRVPVEHKYHLVVNLFTSFGYFEDDSINADVIRNFCNAVCTKGGLVIDYLNPTFVRSTLNPSEEHQLGEYKVVINRFIENNMVKKQICFTHIESQEKQIFKEQVKLFDEFWFSKQFEVNGFKTIRTFGDYYGNSFDVDTSTRLILFLERS